MQSNENETSFVQITIGSDSQQKEHMKTLTNGAEFALQHRIGGRK